MKRFSLCLVAFSLLALSGCVTYKYFDETENRQLSHDQVFKKASSASQFNVADGAGGWGIRLAYVDNYDAYMSRSTGASGSISVSRPLS